MSPSAEMATELILSVWPSSAGSVVFVDTFQSLTTSSTDPDAIFRPSGVNAKSLTKNVLLVLGFVIVAPIASAIRMS